MAQTFALYLHILFLLNLIHSLKHCPKRIRQSF